MHYTNLGVSVVFRLHTERYGKTKDTDRLRDL